MNIGRSLAAGLLSTTFVLFATPRARGQDFVPGTGQRVEEVGDDFEDPDGTYNYKLPKSSLNIE